MNRSGTVRPVAGSHADDFTGRQVRRRVGVVLLGLTLCVALECGGPEVPVLRTPLLAQSGGAELLFRRESVSGGRLLIKNADKDHVYAYDLDSHSVSLVPLESWERASGEIGRQCDVQRGLPGGPRLRIRSRRLLADGRRVRTAGGVVLSFASSPMENSVAVLSADDRFRLGPLFPFLGGGSAGPSGQHYHQLLSVPDLKPVGRPIRLAIKARELMITCWSADNMFVIYANNRCTQMCIVPVEESGS